MKQFAYNACGSIAVYHVLNNFIATIANNEHSGDSLFGGLKIEDFFE